MRKKNITKCSILFLTTMLVGTFEATASGNESSLTSAHVSKDFTQEEVQDSFLENLVVRSDLIFRGTLIDISEGLSLEEIPYTFVTYKIKEIVAGQYFDDTITLKFVGGEYPNGNRLSASNSPQVKIGEDSILMVQQSIDTGCDFVDCEVGRFTIEDGLVIAANESALFVNEDESIKYVSLASRSDDTYSSDMHKSNKSKSNVAGFISYLKRLDKTVVSFRKNSRMTVLNTNKNIPFKAYSSLTQAGSAPKNIESQVIHKPQKLKASPFDQWETEQLKKNGGNPLLSKNYSESQK